MSAPIPRHDRHTVAPSRVADALATAGAAAVGAAVAVVLAGGSLLLVVPSAVGVGLVAAFTRRRTERPRAR